MYIGKDTDGDGIPDVPLRFEMDGSRSVIQFPLGFCPGAIKEDFVYSQSRERLDKSTKECQGQWGLVLKEWETITAVRISSMFEFSLLTIFCNQRDYEFEICFPYLLQTYPKSAKNLNFVTKQLDATMYGDNGGKIPIKNMVDPITMVVERMREKNPDLVVIPGIIPL